MTIEKLESIRDSIKAQLDAHRRAVCAPGQETQKCLNEIELIAALRTVDQIISAERAELAKPPGAYGPVLVGV